MKIGAIVLAGGASRRFGTDNKLLAEISGRPLIRWVTEEVARSGADDLVVVTGCDHLLIEKALGGLLLKFAHNSNWAVGMGFSIAVGVGALSAQVQGALVIPGDLPFLTCDLMKTLVAAFDRSDGDCLSHRCVGRAAQSGSVASTILSSAVFARGTERCKMAPPKLRRSL